MDYILQKIWERKLVFLSTFFLIFTISYIILVAIDLIPEAPKSPTTNIEESGVATTTISETATTTVKAEDILELPLSITIKKLEKTITVLNPDSRSISDLDAALLEGVVRHPDSAALAQDGNVFILGHSSYLPNVINRNFQAFNGIQDLEWGDTIEVSSADSIYRYRVERVYRAKAEDVTVPIAGTERLLTLATCNSFGSADDRYIVEAEQIDVKKI